VSLGPAQVHPQEHLRPVRRLGAARAGRDREHRVLGVVFAAEEKKGPLPLEVRPEGLALALDLGGDLLIRGFVEQREQLRQVAGALLQAPPESDLLAKALSLTEERLRGALVVPEAGIGGSPVERG
jgi:hypothetical protein